MKVILLIFNKSYKLFFFRHSIGENEAFGEGQLKSQISIEHKIKQWNIALMPSRRNALHRVIWSEICIIFSIVCF